MTRSEMNAERRASEERIAKAQAEAQAAVLLAVALAAARGCAATAPCAAGGRASNAGAPNFRARPKDSRCDWDGFTE